MNKGNFTAKSSFPPSTYMLDFLQKQSFMAGNIAQLGGQNYILSGCAENGTTVNAGLIVINGEILPFEAGTKKTKITIQETIVKDHAFGVDYPEAYVMRVAKFNDNGEYNWADFAQVLTNRQLEEKLSSIRGEPPGFKMEWTGRVDRIPDNYKLADGSVLKTADYPELAWYYGRENDESFNLPDLRHLFIVGYDSTKTDYNEIGKTGGLEKVTLTINEIPSHDHVKNRLFNKLSAKAGDIDDQSTPGDIDHENAALEYNVGGMNADRWSDATIQKVGGGKEHENRPPFYTLAFLIKIKY